MKSYYTLSFNQEEKKELETLFKDNEKWKLKLAHCWAVFGPPEELYGIKSGAIEEYDNPKFNPIPKPVFPPNQLLSEGAFKMTTKDAPKSS